MRDDKAISNIAQPLLIRRAQFVGGEERDLRIDAGRIVEVGEGLAAVGNEYLIDAGGNLLLPGLHDHHLHLFATAAARDSLLCGPPAVNDEQQLRALLAGHNSRSGQWLRGVGFHDSVCDSLDRYWLDGVCPDRPLRIQHRSGMMWVLNSRALERLRIGASESLPSGVEQFDNGELTGRFFNLDDWLGAHLERSWPSLRSLSRELAGYGVTGVTDTGVNNGPEVWRALDSACGSGELLQRVVVMGSEELDPDMPSASGRIAVGPLKIYLREAQLPAFDALVQRISAAHDRGRAVAAHCVTRVELTFMLAALREAGVRAGDRIEHASVADDYALESLAELGVTVVTQPHFIAERGARYLEEVEPEDIPLLYRGAGFLRRGVALAAGSDAPYGTADPWAAMRAAVERRNDAGVEMQSAERLTPLQALALFAGDAHNPGSGIRDIAVGQRADLCLLNVPRNALLADLDQRHVALTVCDGWVVYQQGFHASVTAE